jgi:5-methylcytosine-specific restriction endonuclease McrA
MSSRRFLEANRDVVLGVKTASPKVATPVQAVATDAFLSSYEWRRVRMQALKRHGTRCQCCGATPATGAVMNVDHIKPRKLFPELALDVDNLQVLCHECNHGKGNWDMTDWRGEEAKVP